MYIRSREDALAAMAEILEIPGRPAQIVQATVKIALCLELEARLFMMDVQALLIEGGLDALRKRREEALARLTETKIRRRAPGIDVKKDALLDEIGIAIDLLKMVRIVSDVFPAAAARHPQWELARFIHENQGYVREAIEAGLRRRGKPEHAAFESKFIGRVEEKKPWWPEWADSIREACAHNIRSAPQAVHPLANDPETLFHVIAMSEPRAREVLRRMAGTQAEVTDYLSSIRARIDLVLTAQEEAAK